jgi:hypothetical protein
VPAPGPELRAVLSPPMIGKTGALLPPSVDLFGQSAWLALQRPNPHPAFPSNGCSGTFSLE